MPKIQMKNENKVIFNIKLGNAIIKIPQMNDSLVTYVDSLINGQDNNKSILILEKFGHHDSVFMKILDNVSSSFTFNQILNMLSKGNNYFEKLEISTKMTKRINIWVKNLGKYSYTWTELLDKPNYGLEVFKTRFWPFFTIDSKEWKLISMLVLRDSYPNQQDCVVSDINGKDSLTEIKNDYKSEYEISQKYNNFLGYTIMNPEDYPDMNNLILKLRILKKLNLKLLMFEAILRLLITPTTCHIIKETQLWKLVNPLFNDRQSGNLYKSMFFHYMYYCMFILNHEDMIIFSQIRRNYRIIFTHTEAINMPLTYKMHLELDPYIQQLTGVKYLAQSMPYYLRCKRYFHPIDVFERRFTLATGGALSNIPLHKFNAAVSGSILIPCMIYCDLEMEFKNLRFDTKRLISNQISFNDNLYKFCNKANSDEKDFMSYLEYYYPSYHSLLDNDYIDQVLTQSVDVEKTHNVSDEKEEKEYKLKYNALSDIDISITSDNYETFDELAQLLAKQIQLNCKHIGEVWIKKIYTASTFKYKIYGPGLIRPIDLFRIPYGPEKMVKKFHCPIVRAWYDGINQTVDILETQKKLIHSHNQVITEYWGKKLSVVSDDSYDMSYDDIDTETAILPEINILRIEKIEEEPLHNDSEETRQDNEETRQDSEETEQDNEETKQDNEEFKSIHYIGSNIIRSCLTAALSGVNDSYKWFFSSTPAVEVILKYAQRGFTTIINEKEKLVMIEYMKISPRWAPFLNDNNDIMGMMTRNHVFFSPCVLNEGIRHKLKKFKKPAIQLYNRKNHVGLPKTETDFEVDLTVKTNVKVHMPDINKINLFVNHMEQMDQEYSDGDDF